MMIIMNMMIIIMMKMICLKLVVKVTNGRMKMMLKKMIRKNLKTMMMIISINQKK